MWKGSASSPTVAGRRERVSKIERLVGSARAESVAVSLSTTLRLYMFRGLSRGDPSGFFGPPWGAGDRGALLGGLPLGPEALPGRLVALEEEVVAGRGV